MQCVFDKCYDAVKCANDNKGFGFYYSEKQNPDLSIHIHDCCEVLLCISGGKNFLINDKVYDVNDGDLFIINQFEAHKITFDPDKKFCRYVMQVHPEFLYSQSSAQTDLSHCFYTRGGDVSHKLMLSQEERETLVGYIKRLEAEESYGDDIIKKITATQFLILINSAFVSQIGAEKSSGSEAIKKAMDYINLNFSQELSLQKIAENSYISVNQLCRLFNKYCGTTVAKYITSRRITEAKKLLSSGRNVTDTAMLCGFEDYANFIRVFKKHVGVTPGKYNAEK
ncbi:MAG: helix-turn-helix domain-containing protein [Clostridia bacterium]|nr:helix-turn-helix domain-containing protein [Clostridia bacterium]MBQ6937007.1 helix-turn-helix domain-containing protein [Clostridia bacterium]MBR2884701.1 helix-turn-helix domain-containing protein [Clostridia bacterium]